MASEPVVPESTHSFAVGEPVVGRLVGGRYELLEKLGEGGMGEVWVAKQSEPVKRKVALKLIKKGMDSRAVLQRFEQERQALAVMDHPNIAKVLDGGLAENGQPYFVMELVAGKPLTQFCDEAKLTVKDRLDLFVPVCQAIQHAHQKGIVHRDLKPANILVGMVDGKPAPKVIDFGVAKAVTGKLTEDTLSTQFGAVVGTLEYMAPEQAGLTTADVDTRADVYSLGVILYELLTGLRPFDSQRLRKAALDEMLRIIREEEPPSLASRLSTDESLPSIAAVRSMEPARLVSLVKGELAWIVQRCLEKDRNRRYETANGVARDVQRFLADEPVEARPASAGYRLKKFVQRNRGPVVAAASLLLTLLIGIAGTTWGLLEARRLAASEKSARTDADAAKNRETQRAEGERLAKQAALDAMESEKKALERVRTRQEELEAVLKFLETKILAVARPKGQAGGLGKDVKVREALDAAQSAVERDFKNRPLVAAKIHGVLGGTYFYLGEREKAAQHYASAAENCERVFGAGHETSVKWRSDQGVALGDLGRFAESEAIHRKALAWRRTALGASHDDTLISMNNLALALARLGKHEESLRLREDTLRLAKARLGTHHHITMFVLYNLTQSYVALGRFEDALRSARESLEARNATLGATHPETLRSMMAVCYCLDKLGRNEESAKLNAETLRLQTAVVGREHPDSLMTMYNLAKDLVILRRGAEAIPLIDESLALADGKTLEYPFVEMSLDLRSKYARDRIDLQAGRRTAELREKYSPATPQDLYQAARLRASLAGALRAQKGDAQRKEADAEVERSMVWLRKAVTAGFGNVERIEKDVDLHPLREREDFKSLVNDVKTRARAKRPK